MADVMDKIDLFLEELEKVGKPIGLGQTAIVCKDGVVILDTKSGTGVDVMVINNRMDMDYNLGITPEEIQQFKTVTDIVEELGGEQ